MPSSGLLLFLSLITAKEDFSLRSKAYRWRSGGDWGSGSLGGGSEASIDLQMEGGFNNMYGNNENNIIGGMTTSTVRKRVMVLVDGSSHSKHAMMWALTHVANKGDLLTLLHVVTPPHKPSESSSCSTYLVNYLGSICKDCNPEVEVEALVIQGPKLATVMSQVKKLEVSVLVLGQKKPSSLFSCIRGSSSSSTEEFVEHCINKADCLTIGVRKRSSGTGGYLISTKWQKNFWLLA